MFDPEIIRRAIRESFVKLNPRLVAKNPVMFVVEVGAALTTVFVIKDAITGASGVFFGVQIAFWLWFTVVFANFAEAMAEARGKAQADALRKTKTDTMARKLLPNDKFEMVSASQLRAGDVVYCEAGYLIPGDGEVIEGVASVDESVITGESAPVIRESGGDRSAVTGGTKVLSDHIKIKITSESWRNISGSHDCPRGRSGAPEDAQRDRPQYSDRRFDADLFVGRGDVAALCQVRHIGGRKRHRTIGGGSGFSAGLLDPDDHRRAAFRHWHRRHGPRDATAAQLAPIWP